MALNEKKTRRKMSEETKRKISIKRKLFLKEHLENIRGENNPFYGKHHTEESKMKNRLAHLGKKPSEETRKKMSIAFKGRKITWGDKLSESRKRLFREGKIKSWNKGKHWSKEMVKKILRRRTPSSLEQKFIRIINKFNLPYKFVGNGSFWIENMNPDFIECNGKKIAIEVFYKKHKQMFRNGFDEWKNKRVATAKRYGWNILFFDENEINVEIILKRLGEFNGIH